MNLCLKGASSIVEEMTQMDTHKPQRVFRERHRRSSGESEADTVASCWGRSLSVRMAFSWAETVMSRKGKGVASWKPK